MVALIKMDLWLMRWMIPFLVIAPFITVIFFQLEVSQYGVLFALIAGMTLVQMDEKMNTKRFMHALPIPSSAFLPARALVLVLIGFIWVVIEAIAMLAYGMDDAFISHPLYHIASQLTLLFVLAPVILGILTLIKQPVIKWITLFLAYIIIMVIGSIILFLGQGVMDYFGSFGFLLAIGFVLVGILLFWLLSMGMNAIRTRKDLV